MLRKEEIYQYIKAHGRVSSLEVQAAFKMSPSWFSQQTLKLLDEGRITEEWESHNSRFFEAVT